MARAATAFVDFEGDFSKVGRSAGLQSKKLESTFNSSFSRIAKFAVASLATIGIGKVFKDAFSQAEEARRVGKLTAAVLKSTGGIAKVSAKQIDTMANSLSAISGVDDEVIASGENVLLTFTNIRNEAGKGNDIFNQATEAALNLSSALGQDMQSSVVQLGKALNDPIKGVTALQRVGVSFTKQQREQIKTLVESGKTLEAQKLILKELGTEFGGAAAAAATPSKKIGVAIKNIEEALGGLILPLFEKFASFITVTAAPAIQAFVDTLKDVGTFAKIAFQIGFSGKNISGIHGLLGVFAKLGAFLRGFVDFIRGDVASAGVQLGKLFGLEEDDPRVKSFIKALTIIRKALVKVIDFVAKHWKPILVIAAAALLLLVSPVVAVVAGLAFLYLRFKVVRDIVKDVAAGISAAVEVIRAVVSGITDFFTAHQKDFEAIGKQLSAIGDAIVKLWNAIVPLVRAALIVLIGIIVVAVKIIQAFWDRFGKQILASIKTAFTAIAQVVRGALQIVRGIIEIVTGIITLKWDKVWTGIKDVFGGVWNAIAGIARKAIGDLKLIVIVGLTGIINFFKNLPAKFVKAAVGVGRAIVEGVAEGIRNAAQLVIDAVKSILKKIPGGGLITGALHKLHVPFFAEGGIVPGPTGQATLAVVHSGEGVFTEAQMKALGNGGRSTDARTIDARTIVQGNVYGDAHLRSIFEKHDRELVAAIGAGTR